MKRIILTGSFAVLAVLVVSMTASAQGSTRYQADIPFDFTVDGVQWEAGRYIVGPLSDGSTQSVLALRNQKSGKARVIGVAIAGSENSRESGKLYFAEKNGMHALTEISTPTFYKKMKRTRTEVLVTSSGDRSRIVEIALRR